MSTPVMTKTTHTPGPWAYRGKDSMAPDLISGPDGYDVARVAAPPGRPFQSQAAANAHLIAAAPDLLAACEAAAMETLPEGVFRKLQATIAKAKGQ